MRRFAFLFVLAAGVAVAAEEKKEKKPDTTDGTWTIVSMEIGGMKTPEELIKKQAAVLTLTGDKWTMKMADGFNSAGTCKADLTKKPHELDITTTEGPDKGKTIKAVAEMKGDIMKVCYDVSGTDRPKEFSTKDKPTYLLIEYKREKK
jgi:uncharacterized protein (TIGR03067 family)